MSDQLQRVASNKKGPTSAVRVTSMLASFGHISVDICKRQLHCFDLQML
jgi:hypothetical protein